MTVDTFERQLNIHVDLGYQLSTYKLVSLIEIGFLHMQPIGNNARQCEIIQDNLPAI